MCKYLSSQNFEILMIVFRLLPGSLEKDSWTPILRTIILLNELLNLACKSLYTGCSYFWSGICTSYTTLQPLLLFLKFFTPLFHHFPILFLKLRDLLVFIFTYPNTRQYHILCETSTLPYDQLWSYLNSFSAFWRYLYASVTGFITFCSNFCSVPLRVCKLQKYRVCT